MSIRLILIHGVREWLVFIEQIPRSGGRLGGWNHDGRTPRTRSLVDRDRVVGGVRRNTRDIAADCLNQRDARRRVIDMPVGQDVGNDHTGSGDELFVNLTMPKKHQGARPESRPLRFPRLGPDTRFHTVQAMRANWFIGRALNRNPNAFSAGEEGFHELAAGLFMVGYDLRDA